MNIGFHDGTFLDNISRDEIIFKEEYPGIEKGKTNFIKFDCPITLT